MAMRILLADDHRLLMLGIERALEGAEDIEVVGQAVSGSQVLPLIHRLRPDLVLLDLSLPDMSALDCVDEIRRRYPRVQVAALSPSTDRAEIEAAFDHGAVAFIAKTIAPEELAGALRRAVAGELPCVVGEADENGYLGLTARELSMLIGVVRGLSNRAIGRELFVTERTVKYHLNNVYRKLGVRSRTEAAYYAHAHGIGERAAAA